MGFCCMMKQNQEIEVGPPADRALDAVFRSTVEPPMRLIARQAPTSALSEG
jgi:hypothetical protein